jgi:3-isopropylmalate dehydrogenase
VPEFSIAALPGEGVGADNALMQLIGRPASFDVTLAGNLFGDLLSDAASVLRRSIGLSASALLGEGVKGMFEAGHGTALDIARRDVANPIACIRAAGLLLCHAARRPNLSAVVEAAVRSVLGQGYPTADIQCSSTRVVGTERMGDLIADAVRSGSRPAATEH